MSSGCMHGLFGQRSEAMGDVRVSAIDRSQQYGQGVVVPLILNGHICEVVGRRTLLTCRRGEYHFSLSNVVLCKAGICKHAGHRKATLDCPFLISNSNKSGLKPTLGTI